MSGMPQEYRAGEKKHGN